MPAAPPPIAPDPSSGDALTALRQDGWTADLNILPSGGVRCSACGEASTDGLSASRMVRVEGASDPDDEVLAAACTCPRCGAKAVVLAHIGSQMEDGAAEVLAKIEDARPS